LSLVAHQHPKIYHIIHIDRLASVLNDQALLCDRVMSQRVTSGPTIGIEEIKRRRLHSPLPSHPTLRVGDCVPFYFCPRSIMLYLIHCGNHPNLKFTGGQKRIVHLVADLRATVAWAESQNLRWAFTLSNAGSVYFEDRTSLHHLADLDWNAIEAKQWQECREGKQAEFLIENRLPWPLIEQVGVLGKPALDEVNDLLLSASVRIPASIQPGWYY
jgi:hypothetical protein